jgi:hypothetical protein
MCLRFVFLLITRMITWLRLSRCEEARKASEILILRHQLSVMQHEQPHRLKLNWADRTLLATRRRELLDRTLIWNQYHLLHKLREFEAFCNTHRPHQGIANARPLRPLPPPITDRDEIAHLDIRRHQRLGGILNEYRHAA